MPSYRLAEGVYLLPTPGGAYYACSDPGDSPARTLLFNLMRMDQSPMVTAELVRGWAAAGGEQDVIELIHRMQSVAWIQGDTQRRYPPRGSLEQVLPALLGKLSSAGKALLADGSGFYVSTYGYAHETAEELSALSADLASLYERHRRLLRNNIRIASAAWAVVDAAGNSQVGFWPIYVGTERFVLVIAGMPQLNQPAFTDLVWVLAKRYAEVPSRIELGGREAAS